MAETSFSGKITARLRTRLGENFQVIPEYKSARGGLQDIHDLAILEDGHLRILFELQGSTNGFSQAKEELRKFYEKESGEEAFMIAVCTEEELLVFDAENELLHEKYSGEAVDQIVSDISDLLQ